jgi:hypothetical protein
MDHRTDKADTMTARMKAFNTTYRRSPGVNLVEEPHLLRESPFTIGEGVHLGKAGLTLAHLRAWETVIRDYHKHVLIMEDDASPRSLSICQRIAEAAPHHDIILLNQLRPRATGRPLDDSLCLYDVTPHSLYPITPDLLRIFSLLPNVWASSYMISPNGASKMLNMLKDDPIDVDKEEFDWAWMERLMRRPHDIQVAVIGETNRYFFHDENDSDKRTLDEQMKRGE